MNATIVRISGELLKNVLLLPDDSRVTGLRDDFENDCWLMRVESPEFDEIKPRAQIPPANPVYEVTDGKPRFVGWGRRVEPELDPLPTITVEAKTSNISRCQRGALTSLVSSDLPRPAEAR